MQVWPRGHLGAKESGVLDRLFGRVDRTWSNDNNNPVVLPCEDASSGEACCSDSGLTLCGRGNLVAEKCRLDEGVVLQDKIIV